MFIEFSGKSNPSDVLTWEDLLSVLLNLKEFFTSTSEKSKKYSSFSKYYDDTYKHIRKEVNPNETYKMPLTYGQDYGFYKFKERDLNDVKFPRKNCDETKYADIMVRTGKHIMK